jgi:hypothetical protein
MLRVCLLAFVLVGCGAEEEHARQVISGEGQQGFQPCQLQPVETALDRAVLTTGALNVEAECIKGAE